MSARILGAIIAGGRSTRFGEPKALATVGGQRIIDRVGRALEPVTAELVVVANDPVIANAVPWPSRPDTVVGAGALSGLLTALLWADELDMMGTIAVACDMPFVSRPLLDLIDDLARRSPTADVVIPSSNGPRGIEPLCAYYAISCLQPVKDAIDRDDARMIGFHSHVRVNRIPIDVVSALADPGTAFMNVNTREDIERAEQLAASGSG